MSHSDVGQVLSQWHQRTSIVAVGHYRAALRFSRLHFWIALPTVILSAAVGTAVFATLQQQPDFWLQFIVGATSILAAILTALQSTLRYQELAEKHRDAGSKYNALGREIEMLMALSQFDLSKVEDLKSRIDSLATESPHIPQSVHKHMNLESINHWDSPVSIADTPSSRP